MLMLEMNLFFKEKLTTIMEKQAIWPLHIHKKVATALQIQQHFKIQNLISSLQLLRDNLTLWTSDTAAEGEEAEAGADN